MHFRGAKFVILAVCFIAISANNSAAFQHQQQQTNVINRNNKKLFHASDDAFKHSDEEMVSFDGASVVEGDWRRKRSSTGSSITPLNASSGLVGTTSARCSKGNHQHYHGIQPVGGLMDKEQEYYAADHKLAFECHVRNDSFHQQQHLRKRFSFPVEYFVYPTPTRVCQSNGKWSGVPPICLWSNNRSNRRWGVNKRASKALSSDDLCRAKQFESWESIGRLHKSCFKSAYSVTPEDKLEQKRVYIEFDRHVHLSFMTFHLPVEDGAGRLTKRFNIEIKVPSESVIREISLESIAYLRDDYDSFAEHVQQVVDKSCAVVEIAAYTKTLLISYSSLESTADENKDRFKENWEPQPTFYQVEELPSIRRNNMNVSRYLLEPSEIIPANGIITARRMFDETKTFTTTETLTFDENETKNLSNRDDSVSYIVTAVLLVIGLVSGSIVTVVCMKRRALSRFDEPSNGKLVDSTKRRTTRTALTSIPFSRWFSHRENRLLQINRSPAGEHTYVYVA